MPLYAFLYEIIDRTERGWLVFERMGCKREALRLILKLMFAMKLCSCQDKVVPMYNFIVSKPIQDGTDFLGFFPANTQYIGGGVVGQAAGDDRAIGGLDRHHVATGEFAFNLQNAGG